jgi:hypothetical protein
MEMAKPAELLELLVGDPALGVGAGRNEIATVDFPDHGRLLVASDQLLS